ncbi:hypothetical protein PanWU01x14_165190 [Parasponia andersonii]|uniref:Uncharacterized protein n=1 Tax=Parasponia andersonii TaxID=3476 RepID=A0A2P5CC43_PARAD|nr:hypothetical protein PanWU01x14_165190 [Parasponia andersonii]
MIFSHLLMEPSHKYHFSYNVVLMPV